MCILNAYAILDKSFIGGYVQYIKINVHMIYQVWVKIVVFDIFNLNIFLYVNINKVLCYGLIWP